MSIMSNAASIGQGLAGADSAFTRLGLSMRFVVLFSNGDGIDKLGAWSACKGLKVDFNTEVVKYGGDYNGEVKLPTVVKYSPVVLERAMDQKNSADLQKWLGKLVNSWMNYAENGKSPPMGTVSITLQDVYQNAVASWHLQGAYPASWTGPDLDAKSNAVAIEKLTLEHQGFLPPSSGLSA